MHFSDIIAGQIEWSARTFGPREVRSHVGVLDHITKEIDEIEAEPTDLEEWIDLIVLAVDGAFRATNATPDEIEEMYLAKLRKNFQRTWPDWRTADPDKAIEHVR